MADEFLNQLSAVPYADLTETNCPICSEDYNTTDTDGSIVEQPVRLPCNHIVGRACITIWLFPSEQAKNTCPFCRREFFEHDAIVYGDDEDSDEDSDDTASVSSMDTEEEEANEWREEMDTFLGRIDYQIHVHEVQRRDDRGIEPRSWEYRDERGIERNVYWQRPAVKAAWIQWRDDWMAAAINHDEDAAKLAAAAMGFEVPDHISHDRSPSFQTLRFREMWWYYNHRDGRETSESADLVRKPKFQLREG